MRAGRRLFRSRTRDVRSREERSEYSLGAFGFRMMNAWKIAWSGCVLVSLARAAAQQTDPFAGEGLEQALLAIRAEHIRSDVFFFADDEMGGRDTPSPGLAAAAAFVRARLERLGFQPGAGADFYQRYDVGWRRLDPARSHLMIEGAIEGALEGASLEPLVFGKDYFFSSFRDVRDLEVAGAVVYCGSGGKGDLEGLDLTGRWALCTGSEVSVTRRRRSLEHTGAVGLLVMPASDAEEKTLIETYEETTMLALRGAASPASSHKESTDKGLAHIILSRPAARALLAASPARRSGQAESWTPPLGADLGLVLRETREGWENLSVANVCGFWPGSDERLRKEVIVLSAHYDHVGTQRGEIYNGADDNASGSMGLLAVAEALQRWGPLRRSVMLLWLSGEEKGLWGSEQWTRSPTLPPGFHPICDLNIDMIGRNAPNYLLITPSELHSAYNGLTPLLEKLAPLEGFPELGSCDDYWARSDHINFSKNLKIPVAFLFSDVHEDYHRPTDDPEKIDCDKIARVARLLVRAIGALQTNELALQPQANPEANR